VGQPAGGTAGAACAQAAEAAGSTAQGTARGESDSSDFLILVGVPCSSAYHLCCESAILDSTALLVAECEVVVVCWKRLVLCWVMTQLR
jgi:hypothetical protein